MKKLLSFIDALSIWTGKTGSWLIFIVVFFIMYEVLSRYIFHHPTLWVTESVVFGCGLSYVLGTAWALQDNRFDNLYLFCPVSGGPFVGNGQVCMALGFTSGDKWLCLGPGDLSYQNGFANRDCPPIITGNRQIHPGSSPSN